MRVQTLFSVAEEAEMTKDLSLESSLSQLQASPEVMSALGRAMYEIRAPLKSQRIPFEHLSVGQQKANQEKAIEIMFSTSISAQDSREKLVDNLAQHFYKTLAPQKSATEPWNSRSEYHHAWYRSQATAFMQLLRDNLQSDNSEIFVEQQVFVPAGQRGSVLDQTSALNTSGRLDSLIKESPSTLRLEKLRIDLGESVEQLGDESLSARGPEVGTGSQIAESSTLEPEVENRRSTGHALAIPLYLIAALLVVLIAVLIIS
jgi:hypothetical protein